MTKETTNKTTYGMGENITNNVPGEGLISKIHK